MAIKVELDRDLAELDRMAPAGYFLGLHIRFVAPVLTYQTYCQEWLDHYTQQGYALRDPMIAWGFSTIGTTRWSEIDIPDPFGIFAEAAEFGLKFGVSVSCGPTTSRTIAGVAREDHEFIDEEIHQIRDLVLRLHEITEPPESLTEAQLEALRLIAAGDRHAAAAAKLGISESALKARLVSARQRLMARTTAEAIQRAKDNRVL